jgi:hypothetical protein
MTSKHIQTRYEYAPDGSITAVVRVNRCKQTATHITLLDDCTAVIRRGVVHNGTIYLNPHSQLSVTGMLAMSGHGDARGQRMSKHRLIRNGQLDTYRLHKILRNLHRMGM